MAIRSSLANNATPSSNDSRSPASTFSAIALSSFDNAVEIMPFSVKPTRARGIARQSDYTNIVLRTKAKGKNQKAKGKNNLPNLHIDKLIDDSFHLQLLPFDFCLLPSHRRWAAIIASSTERSRR
jgi:hypothetical protein